jgi:hypothetical protein
MIEREMPKYKCHKEVWALKIKSIVRDGEGEERESDGSAMITPEEEGYAPFKVDNDYMEKHKPHVGGYYVVYEGGYKSFSPADAFESGYTRIVNNAAAQVFEGTQGEWDALVKKNKITTIAMACHEAIRVWRMSYGDYSQQHWNEAEEWQRQRAIDGVLFRLDFPGTKHDAQHNAWMQDKINEGWKYGEVKDDEKKTNPFIVPFEQLPESLQKKDALFCAIVYALK